MIQKTGGMPTLDDLWALAANGAIDTVVNALCDMQGRLVGKRVTGDDFVEHGTHFCVYLLGTDIELTTPDGFPGMSWETGYGDWLARPDWSTLRVIPWLEKTALVLADAVDESTGQLVSIAPRSILRRQIERAASLGFRPKMATELEFYLLAHTYEEAHARGFQNLERVGWYDEDYQLLQATKSEPLYRQLRNQMSAAGIPIEFSKGEAAADHSVIDTPVDVWDRVMAVNVRGIYLCCKYAIPEMLRIGGGSIVNIASFVALVGCSVPQDAYTASKGAVISLTKSLAIQFHPSGIRTNAICPGPIETPMLLDWLLKDADAKQLRLNRQPSVRFGKPQDIVNCALYLASDESDWTNGAVLVVDGGITSN